MPGKYMKQKARSASSCKVDDIRVVTPISEFGKEELNKQIRPKLEQNKREIRAGYLYVLGKTK